MSNTEPPPDALRPLATLHLAPGVASVLYLLAEYRDIHENQGRALSRLIGPALARQVAEALPLPELPAALGPSAIPQDKAPLSLPPGLLLPGPGESPSQLADEGLVQYPDHGQVGR